MSKKPLMDVLETLEHDILFFRQRWELLKEIQETLQRHSRDGYFVPANYFAHYLISDGFEMFVIDLASFAKSNTQKGGLLPGLKQRTKELERRILDEPEKHRQKYINHSYAYLFPYSSGDRPSNEDIDLLIERWTAETQRIVDVRNQLHAHKHERSNRSLTPQPITSDEIINCLEFFERALNSLRLLHNDSTLDYHTIDRNEIHDTAHDLADIVLLGSSENAQGRFMRANSEEPWRRREDYYLSDHWRDTQDGWELRKARPRSPEISKELACKSWLRFALEDFIVGFHCRQTNFRVARALEVQAIEKTLKSVLIYRNHISYESLARADANRKIDQLVRGWGHELSKLLLLCSTAFKKDEIEGLLSRNFGSGEWEVSGRQIVVLFEKAYLENRYPGPRMSCLDHPIPGKSDMYFDHLSGTDVDGFLKALMSIIRKWLTNVGLWDEAVELVPATESGVLFRRVFGWPD